MPKNKGKGGKNRRRGKNENEDFKRELIIAEPGQTYAKVTKMLGSSNLEAMCADNQRRLCHIRGKMNKKVWINMGDIILVGVRDFQDDKADVILKYTGDEARILRKKGQIPEFLATEDSGFGQEQVGDDIYFAHVSDEESDEDKNEEFFGRGNLNKDSTVGYDSSELSDDEQEEEHEESDDE
ncbi:unnamed protein product [Brachionus calyciflorus]|uniref:S1-like domain-containing protein n=1 Tax=Brachionus calyciflorus TaxID=104777 RepID=A0A813MX75_9BILA|nr:unnamed protein product [Brachionus calyciflorus]